MWRSGSGLQLGGQGRSEAPGGVPSSNSDQLPNSSSQWHISRTSSGRLLNPTRRCSAELTDPLRNEAIKFIRDLNKAVANTLTLAALIGGSGDGPHLRDEFRRSRRSAQEAAHAAKSILLPSILDQRSEKERKELERIWLVLICLLDALESSMQRSLALLRDFSLADGGSILIHTGLDHQRGEVHGESAILDKLALLEGVEASQLCKELFELRAQLEELKSAVDLRYLYHEGGSDGEREEGHREGHSGGDTLINMTNGHDGLAASSISCSIPSDDKASIEYDDEGSQEGITPAQRRCICYILITMVSIFLLSMVLGLMIAIFS